MSSSLLQRPLDALGRYHAPHANPRIASLVPSITETLFSFGLGRHVVARTGFCIHPEPAIRDVPKVGGTKDVNLAKLIATEPTHVIVNIDENERPMVEKIARSIPNVIVTHPIVPEDNIALFQLLGHVFARPREADALSQSLLAALRDARSVGQSAPIESVLYLIWKNPWMTVSRDTYISAMLATVGWRTEPVQTERRYPEIHENDPIWGSVDRVLLSTEPFSFDDEHAQLLSKAHHLRTPAQLIDGEMTSWYGTRAIQGLRYLMALRSNAPQLSRPALALNEPRGH
ncbi:MAG: cobalamin-binding protein [Burkholderiales bacterium]|nr:MAG: cobalamin-binding protein [Burkholderiales bacterium]TAG83014.1 MAG: cobalamin-binding protein [Betaproteobacteria bacterium]